MNFAPYQDESPEGYVFEVYSTVNKLTDASIGSGPSLLLPTKVEPPLTRHASALRLLRTDQVPMDLAPSQTFSHCLRPAPLRTIHLGGDRLALGKRGARVWKHLKQAFQCDWIMKPCWRTCFFPQPAESFCSSLNTKAIMYASMPGNPACSSQPSSSCT